jgi:hypothetical protein
VWAELRLKILNPATLSKEKRGITAALFLIEDRRRV